MNRPREARYRLGNLSVGGEQQRMMASEVRGRGWREFEQHSWILLMIVRYQYCFHYVSVVHCVEDAKSKLYF